MPNETFSYVTGGGFTVRGVFKFGAATITSVTAPDGRTVRATGVRYAEGLLADLEEIFRTTDEAGAQPQALVQHQRILKT